MDAHRKIELQSPADLQFLTTNLQAAATQRLNNALPPSPTSTSTTTPPSPDAYRAKVESLVSQFIAEVQHSLRGNISINGLDVVPDTDNNNNNNSSSLGTAEPSVIEVQEYEPYDEKLRIRLATLIHRRDVLISKISKHRRATPAVAAERVRRALQCEIEAQDKAWEEQVRAAKVVEVGDLVHVEIKRQEEVSRNWERAVEGLGRLKGGLGETRARLERAGDVVGYLDGQKTGTL